MPPFCILFVSLFLIIISQVYAGIIDTEGFTISGDVDDSISQYYVTYNSKYYVSRAPKSFSIVGFPNGTFYYPILMADFFPTVITTTGDFFIS